uniref:Uncharacterized protein n=1 Tax=Arundo donax TaxID=35708 RepID=A0A0A9CFF0_ARUDO
MGRKKSNWPMGLVKLYS